MSQYDSNSRRANGDRIRRQVLGDEYVDGAHRSAFSEPLQELVTEFCWGGPWSRDGLPKQTRSLINLAILTALNRPHELKLHTKGALRNGCSREEIIEVLLQATVYAGIPAGVDAFRVAEQAIQEFSGLTNEANDSTRPMTKNN